MNAHVLGQPQCGFYFFLSLLTYSIRTYSIRLILSRMDDLKFHSLIRLPLFQLEMIKDLAVHRVLAALKLQILMPFWTSFQIPLRK